MSREPLLQVGRWLCWLVIVSVMYLHSRGGAHSRSISFSMSLWLLKWSNATRKPTAGIRQAKSVPARISRCLDRAKHQCRRFLSRGFGDRYPSSVGVTATYGLVPEAQAISMCERVALGKKDGNYQA